MIKSRRIRLARHVARMGRRGLNIGKRPLGRQRRRWMDNIKMDLRVNGWDDVDLIDMAQDRDWWRAPRH
jgi:hypothetical protein